jgi:hypothetical protein
VSAARCSHDAIADEPLPGVRSHPASRPTVRRLLPRRLSAATAGFLSQALAAPTVASASAASRDGDYCAAM